MQSTSLQMHDVNLRSVFTLIAFFRFSHVNVTLSVSKLPGMHVLQISVEELTFFLLGKILGREMELHPPKHTLVSTSLLSHPLLDNVIIAVRISQLKAVPNKHSLR